MSSARLHRRLAVGMGVAGLTAFAGGAGLEPISAALAAAGLLLALLWQPGQELSRRLERVWLPLAFLLALRAAIHFFLLGGDVVLPVVDLLLLLLVAEALRSLDADNDIRLYALSFALLLASTAYRPGALFAAAFVAYAVLGVVAVTLGHLRRRARVHGFEAPRPGLRFLLGTGGLSLVVLVVAVGVFLTFPRVSRAWSGRGDVAAESVVGFSDEVSITAWGSRIRPNPRTVLRVEFPEGAPADVGSLHWRGRSYDRFDGRRWSRSRGMRPANAPWSWYERWSDDTVVQRIWATPLDVRVLFGLHPVLDAEPLAEIHPLFDQVGDWTYWGNTAPAYEVVSAAGRPSPERLRAAEDGFTPDARHYLQLPALDPRIAELADSLTAGLETRYDKTVAVERWLQREFAYTLELPATERQTSLSWFLFERRAGHCEYFSTAMAVLLRSAGIHARNVNGFLGGRWSRFGEYLVVTENEAHSWVEVWFPGLGWVQFDPTPSGAGERLAGGAWEWPGHMLFDGLQHRWNKWILDYGAETQIDLLERLFGGGAEGPGRGTADGRGWNAWLALALGLVLLGAAWRFRGGRARAAERPESRLYAKLVEACRRSGVTPAGPVTPLALVERLAGHPARAPASELVERYLAVRFGGRPLEPRERRAMRRALGESRRRLRDTTRRRRA